MPRYFFHMHINEDDVARDPVGIEVPNLEMAIAEAEKARVEIMDEDALDQLWLEIMDEAGQVVAKVGYRVV
jgi:hypothetical protein